MGWLLDGKDARIVPSRVAFEELGSWWDWPKDFVGQPSYLLGMGSGMELRHLRCFIAVAEEGSLTLAAERRLHTAQRSLSRQMRDLELEVGVDLLACSSRGVVLTSAGKVFLARASGGDAEERSQAGGAGCG
jgi:hypothetical protein